MNALGPLLSRAESVAAVPTPEGVEALPSWLRFVSAQLVAQVLAGERCALAAARAATSLERTEEGRALAARQTRDEARHVAFFVETQRRLGFERPVDVDVAALLAKAGRADDLVSLLMGTHLVIETLGHALFDATAALLSMQSTNRLFSVQTRVTLGELSMSMERLQRDESQHLAYGVLRLREERSRLDAAGQERFDAQVRAWRSDVATLFLRLPSLFALRPWLPFWAESVLAHFDARVKAVVS
jgi:hypothetical protein